MIRSFGNTMTERLWSRERTKKLDPRIERTALGKLVIVDAAETLDDLRVPPDNRLEALRGRPDRSTQHPDQPAVAGLLHLDACRT